MAAIVIDASALVEVLTGRQPDRGLRQRVLKHDLNAPELLPTEVLSVLRRRVRRGLAAPEQADRAVTWLAQAPVALAGHRQLVARAWQLRNSVTAYDSLYVALAEQLGVPLVTTDAKLAGSNGHRAEVEVYPAS